jgi:SAM-dependent methyltransferase
MTMNRRLCLAALLLVAFTHLLVAQQEPDARQIKQEREQADLDAPKLLEVLEITPGMAIADIGSGGGAMTVVLGHWNRGGRVFATDITERALRITREYAKKEGLTNVTVIEGAAAATNLPDECCDAVFLRHVYHHVTEIAAFNKSLHASLKPGGRLAIIDFEVRQPNPAEIPKGVPANRLGHGIPASVVIEEVTGAGFTHVRTIAAWPPGDKNPVGFLTLFRK